jgi:hypothetical protein
MASMKKYLLFLSLSFVVGCTTHPKKEAGTPGVPGVQAVQWETKAQVRDFKQNKTNNLSIDIIAVKNTNLRMEVSALLGYSVATLVTTPKDIKVAVYTQKKFYQGHNSEEALQPVLGFNLDPNIFHNIIFDIPIKGWVCEENANNQVSLCKKKTKKGDLVVAWPERKEGSKRVIIQGPQFEMQWQFKEQNVVQQLKPETFKLDPPSGYKVITL